MCHIPRVTCHMSHVMRHMSGVTFHMSGVLFFGERGGDIVVELDGGGSVINEAYPV